MFGAAALLCTVLALAAPFTVDEPHAVLRGVGAALYVVGTFGVTVAINVAMNVQLESADADSPEARTPWHRSLSRWTAWNTCRSILGAAAPRGWSPGWREPSGSTRTTPSTSAAARFGFRDGGAAERVGTPVVHLGRGYAEAVAVTESGVDLPGTIGAVDPDLVLHGEATGA